MVLENGGFAAAARPAATRFFLVVAGVFQRRLPYRRGRKSEVLEGSESSRLIGEARGCPRSSARLESRRMRSRVARAGGCRGGEGRPADQCDAPRYCRPIRG